MSKKDKIIFELYKLIDDIDTATDMFKGDYKGFTNNTANRVRGRFSIVPDKYINKLYKRYYNSDGVMERNL